MTTTQNSTSPLRSSLIAILALFGLAACSSDKDSECNPAIATCPETVQDDTAGADSGDGDDTGETDEPIDPDYDGDGSPNSVDCDDDNATVYPGATELCDGIDNDCDGATDEEIPTWYRDADVDGYGNPDIAIAQCEAPTGFVLNGDDCDDAEAEINPAASESCNGEDDDCDGTADEDFDVDGDSYSTCEDDCDDADPEINPGASEIQYDGVDNDCESSTRDDDLDSDGFDSTTTGGSDCDDLDGAINPDATETCNGDDDDCDGSIDESDAVDADTWYLDDDGDSFGDPDSSTDSCDAPTGYVADSTDCDDGDADSYPGATETEDDGVDQDCDGSDAESSVTSSECWDSIPYDIASYSIDWSTATTTSGNWSGGLSWTDTDIVQILDASTSSNYVHFYESCGSSTSEGWIYLPDSYAFPSLGDEYNNGIIAVLQPSGVIYEVNFTEDCGDGTWGGYVLPDSSPMDACDSGIDTSRWLGAHGGSHITATQALREGELVGSSPIGRPLPVEVDATHLACPASATTGYDCHLGPLAASGDSYALSDYTGSVSDLSMGSILVLPESYDCTTMTTTPGERLCEVARDFGLFIVDDSDGEDEVAFPISTEAKDEAEADLGHSLHNFQSTSFGSDVETIFGDILVLTNPETAWTM